MSSVQRIRLPSVNDIFPINVENHHQHHQPHPQVMTIQLNANYIAQPNQGAYIPHAQGPPAPVQVQPPPPPHIVQQPIPYNPQNYIVPSGAIPIHHPHPQQVTPAHSPIDYISTNGPVAPVAQGAYPPQAHYQYHQPRLQVHSPNNKYRIHKSQHSPNATRQSNAWSSNDDELLKYLKEVKNLGWREISMYFQNRTANGCQFRWRRIVALAKTSSPPSSTAASSPVKSNESMNKDNDLGHEDEEEEEENSQQSHPSIVSSNSPSMRSNSLESLLN